MTKMNKLLVLFLLAVSAFAQQNTTNQTTLSASIVDPFPPSAGGLVTTISVTSATNMTVPSFGTSGITTFLFVDRELMGVIAINGTSLTVRRGQGGSKTSSHLSGAIVWWGPQRYFLNVAPAGLCTPNNIIASPAVVVADGSVWVCSGVTSTAGIWAQTINGADSNGAGSAIGNFCTGTAGSGEIEFLNGAACSGATTATARVVIQANGVIGNLYAYSSAIVVSGGSDPVAVLKNGVATTITCTMVSLGTTCSDTTHFVQVAVGDVITFRFTSTASDSAANISVGLGKY